MRIVWKGFRPGLSVLLQAMVCLGGSAVAQERNDSPISAVFDRASTAVMQDAEGGLLVTGKFDQVNGQPLRRFCRLDATGAVVDAGPPLRADGTHHFTQGTDAVLFSPFTPLLICGQSQNEFVPGQASVSSPGFVTGESLGEWWKTTTLASSLGSGSRVLCATTDRQGRVLIGVQSHGIRRMANGNSADSSFGAQVNGSVNSILPLRNGQMIVGCTTFDGSARLIRLNEDGSVDGGFPAINGAVTSVAETAAGELWVAGDFTTVAGASRTKLAKLTANGALMAVVPPTVDNVVNSLSVQWDGRVLIGGNFTYVNGGERRGLVRVMPDGTLDASFMTDDMGWVSGVSMQLDGAILVGGSEGVDRLENPTAGGVGEMAVSNGEIRWPMGAGAPVLSRVIFEGWTPENGWQDLGAPVRESWGWRLWIGSSETAPQTVRARGLLRGGFGCGSTVEVVRVGHAAAAVYPKVEVTDDTGRFLNGKISTVDLGSMSVGGTAPPPRRIRVRNSGNAPLEVANVSGFFISPLTIKWPTTPARVLAPGEWFEVEPTVTPTRLGEISGAMVIRSNAVNAAEVRVPLKVTITETLAPSFGSSTYYDTQKVVTVALPLGGDEWVMSQATVLPANGEFGLSMDAGPTVEEIVMHRVRVYGSLLRLYGPSIVRCAAVAADGSLFQGGTVTTSEFLTRNQPVSLLRDFSFQAGAGALIPGGEVRCVKVLADGKLLLGGMFRVAGDKQGEYVNTAVVRLHPDGTRDKTYAVLVEAPLVTSMVLMDDGKLVVARSSYGTQEPALLRLLPDGQLDTGFEVPLLGNANALGLDSVGRVVVGLDGGGVRRLTAHGDWDPSLNLHPGAKVETLLLRADGRILAGGTSIPAFSQHLGNGVPEPLGIKRYESLSAANSLVTTLMAEDDGRLLVGGAFLEFGQVKRSRFVRWPATVPAVDELKVGVTGEAVWERGGSAGVLEGVVFERWSGAGWQRMGQTVRETGGLRAAGGSVPLNGYVRARGWMSGGWRGGSGRQVERMLKVGNPAEPEMVVRTTQGQAAMEGQPLGSFTRETAKAPALLRITLENAGNGPLTGIRVIVLDVPEGAVKVESAPTFLAAGEVGTVVLRQVKESGTGRLIVESHDPMRPLRKFRFSGVSLSSAVEVTDESGRNMEGVGGINLGMGNAGQVLKRRIRVKNTGELEMTVILNVSGEASDWLTVTPPIRNNLLPGQAANFELSGTVPVTGTLRAMLAIAGSGGVAEGPFEVTLSTREAPQVTGQPVSQLVRTGDEVLLTVVATGMPVPRYQWRRNGQPVPGAAGATLRLTSAGLADGGIYDCVVASGTGANAARVLTGAAGVTVVERRSLRVAVEAGKRLRFPLLVSGPGTVSWEHEEQATMRVSGPPWGLAIAESEGSGTYRATVEVAGVGTLNSGDLEVSVYEQEPELLLPLMLPQGRVGEAYEFTVPVNSDPARAPERFVIQGLPPGLVLDVATGEISGKPTKAAVPGFALTVMAMNAKGEDVGRVRLPVVDMPAGLEGSYEGILERHPLNGELGGRFSLKVTRDGQFSGKITLGKVGSGMRGSLDVSDEGAVMPEGMALLKGKLAGMKLLFAANLGTQELTALTVEDAEGGSVSGAGWKVGAGGSKSGLHTFQMDYAAGDPWAGSDLTPQGLGAGSLHVAESGRATLSARMPDGAVLTGSAALGAGGQVAVLSVKKWGRLAGSVVGKMVVAAGPTPDLADNTVGGELSQMKPNSKDKAYPMGFGPLTWRVTGGGYAPPTWLFAVTGAGENLLEMVLERGGLERSMTAPGRMLGVTPDNRLEVTEIAEAEGVTRVSVNARTGAISGSFSLVDWDPVAAVLGLEKRVVRRVPFQGRLVKVGGHWKGAGWFALRQLSGVRFDGKPIPPGVWTGRMSIFKR